MSENKILLSIMVPSFNDAKYIEKCVLSALDCKRNDFEIVICDDCSDNSTIKLLNKLDEDERVRCYYSSKRLGIVKIGGNASGYREGNGYSFFRPTIIFHQDLWMQY